MKTKLTSLLAILTLALITSCASHQHVRAGADGIHHVVIRATDKVHAEELAISEANSYCDTFKKTPAFVSEKTNYTGQMDEETHNTIKKVAKISTIGGAMMGTMGGKKESNVGEGLFGVGAVGQATLDDDAYTSDMTFKCQ